MDFNLIGETVEEKVKRLQRKVMTLSIVLAVVFALFMSMIENEMIQFLVYLLYLLQGGKFTQTIGESFDLDESNGAFTYKGKIYEYVEDDRIELEKQFLTDFVHTSIGELIHWVSIIGYLFYGMFERFATSQPVSVIEVIVNAFFILIYMKFYNDMSNYYYNYLTKPLTISLYEIHKNKYDEQEVEYDANDTDSKEPIVNPYSNETEEYTKWLLGYGKIGMRDIGSGTDALLLEEKFQAITDKLGMQVVNDVRVVSEEFTLLKNINKEDENIGGEVNEEDDKSNE